MATDSEHLMIPAPASSLTSPNPPSSDPHSSFEHVEHDPEAAGVIRDLDWYTNVNSIGEVLKGGDVVLVKGTFLVNLAEAQSILPCRQELPAEATWDIDDFVKRQPQTIAISYCWHSVDHPDPRGSQLQLISSYLSTKVQFIGQSLGCMLDDVAVFWDYCSLYQPRQHHAGGQRSLLAPEEASMKRALQSMHFWYTHGMIHTWCQTTVPKGMKKYEERGWPTWELNVSRLLTGVADSSASSLSSGGPCIIDLASFPHLAWPLTPEHCRALQNLPFTPEHTIAKMASHSRDLQKPPLTPEQFDVLIEQKTFSVPDVDLPLIKEKYEEAFSQILGNVTTLRYASLPWSTEDIRQLCSVLPCCRKLQELDISGMTIDREGCMYLVEALPLCMELQVLQIDISDENEDILDTLPRKCPNLDVRVTKELVREFFHSFDDLADSAYRLINNASSVFGQHAALDLQGTVRSMVDRAIEQTTCT